MPLKKYRRNDPCPCGSGKKYKRCCSLTHEIQRGKNAQTANLQAAEDKKRQKASLRNYMDGFIEAKDLTERSNTVADMIRNDLPDEAEIEAKRLTEDFPDATDGLEHLAWVYENRNNKTLAVEYYSKAIAQLRLHNDEDNEHLVWLENLAKKLVSSV